MKIVDVQEAKREVEYIKCLKCGATKEIHYMDNDVEGRAVISGDKIEQWICIECLKANPDFVFII